MIALQGRCWRPCHSVKHGVCDSTLFCYGLGAEMLNFGALIAFMGVNMAAFVRYYVREGGSNAIAPLLLVALVIALVLWPNSWPDSFTLTAGVLLAILAVWTPPLAGFTICFFLWKNLSWNAWIVGGIWMISASPSARGKTQGFRGNLVNFELPPEE